MRGPCFSTSGAPLPVPFGLACDSRPSVLAVPIEHAGDGAEWPLQGAAQTEVPVLSGDEVRVVPGVGRKRLTTDDDEGDGGHVPPQQLVAAVFERPAEVDNSASVGDLVPRRGRTDLGVVVEIGHHGGGGAW